MCVSKIELAFEVSEELYQDLMRMIECHAGGIVDNGFMISVEDWLLCNAIEKCDANIEENKKHLEWYTPKYPNYSIMLNEIDYFTSLKEEYRRILVCMIGKKIREVNIFKQK